MSKPLSSQYKTLITQHIKLESDGMDYRLPYVNLFFEDSSSLRTTFLSDQNDPNPPAPVYGWLFGVFNNKEDNGVPGTGWYSSATANYWTITMMEITSTGGKLFVKPGGDDPSNPDWRWTDGTFGFKEVASMEWAHTSIEKMSIEQPWDSVNYVNYVEITTAPVPIPPSILLLGTGLISLVGSRRRFKK